MRLVRTAALSRHRAPPVTILRDLEKLHLFKAAPYVRWLFVELLALDFTACGYVVTSWAVLASLMDYDKAPGAHTDESTIKRVRTALETLIFLGLVETDAALNEAAKGLFLTLPGRVQPSSSANRKGRWKGRPQNGAKLELARVAAVRPHEEGQMEGQGIQEREIPPKPPSLSTGARPKETATQRAMKSRLRPAAALK